MPLLREVTELPDSLELDFSHPFAEGLEAAWVGAHGGGNDYYDSGPFGMHADWNGTTFRDWVWQDGWHALEFQDADGRYLQFSGKFPTWTGPLSVVASVWNDDATWPRDTGCRQWGMLRYLTTCGFEVCSANHGDLAICCPNTTSGYFHYARSNANVLTENSERIGVTWNGSSGSGSILYRAGKAVADGYVIGSGTALDPVPGMWLGRAQNASGGIDTHRILWLLKYTRVLGPNEMSELHDPSNIMLSGLILPPARKWWPVTSPTVGNPYYAYAQQ